MRGPSVMPGLSPTEGASLGRGMGVGGISADAPGEPLDGSATPLRRSFLGEHGDGARRPARRETDEEVCRMTFDQWLELVRTYWKREEGQTMAEYGVVLAVITIGAVAVFTAPSGGISGALNPVIGPLPPYGERGSLATDARAWPRRRLFCGLRVCVCFIS